MVEANMDSQHSQQSPMHHPRVGRKRNSEKFPSMKVSPQVKTRYELNITFSSDSSGAMVRKLGRTSPPSPPPPPWHRYCPQTTISAFSCCILAKYKINVIHLLTHSILRDYRDQLTSYHTIQSPPWRLLNTDFVQNL